MKLGPHSLVETTDTLTWARLRPTVVKFCYDFHLAEAVPEGVLRIGRPDEAFLHSLVGDPLTLARQMAQEVYKPLVQLYPHIDAWEGTNEVNPATTAEMSWYAFFLAELARQIFLLGKRAVIGNWATGTPEMEMWPFYRPALDAERNYGAILSRHSYGPLDEWHTYRHRKDQAIFRSMGYNPKLVITECGEDAPNPPWRKKYGDDIRRYWNEWIKPFEQEIEKDDWVIGATLFTVGTGGGDAWKPFNVEGTGLVDILREEIPMAETVNTVPDPGLSVVTTTVGIADRIAPVMERVYAFHRELSRWLAGQEPSSVVVSRKESSKWVLIFTDPSDILPRARRVTWDMDVVERWTSPEGVVWLRVNVEPSMWVLADQTAGTP